MGLCVCRPFVAVVHLPTLTGGVVIRRLPPPPGMAIIVNTQIDVFFFSCHQSKHHPYVKFRPSICGSIIIGNKPNTCN